MKRFSFNLQRVADVREIRRRIAEERLGLAAAERVVAERELEEAQLQASRAQQQVGEMICGIIDTERLKFVLAYERKAREAETEKRDLLEKADAKLEAARSEAIRRISDHEVMLRLRQRLFRSYVDDYWWEQGKVLDEVGVMRHRRQRPRRSFEKRRV